MFGVDPRVQMTLASARVRIRMNQEEAAKRIGVTVQTLRAWEKDSSKLGYDRMKKCADVYHVPVDHIFFGNTITFSNMLKGEEVG